MEEEFISRNIKSLRKKRKITLEELANRTGLTKGYISKIERSKKAPPYATLNKIALALGVDAAFLLEESLQNPNNIKITLTKKNKGKVVHGTGSLPTGSLYGCAHEALAFNKPGKNMEPFLFEPSFEEDAVFQHEGEEFLYVLEGVHELIYGGKPYVMEEGDSVYFDAGVPHSGRSMGKQKAKLLAVMFNYKRL